MTAGLRKSVGRRRMEEADDPEAEEADGEADEAPEAFKDEEEER